MAIEVNSIINTIKTGITGIAQTSLKNYLPQVEADAQSIANVLQSNIEAWTTQLTSGAISADDLKDLILTDEDVLKVAALTQKGLAQIQLDQFKQQVANLIVTTITGALKV